MQRSREMQYGEGYKMNISCVFQALGSWEIVPLTTDSGRVVVWIIVD